VTPVPGGIRDGTSFHNFASGMANPLIVTDNRFPRHRLVANPVGGLFGEDSVSPGYGPAYIHRLDFDPVEHDIVVRFLGSGEKSEVIIKTATSGTGKTACRNHDYVRIVRQFLPIPS
jgi:hypothetical protein